MLMLKILKLKKNGNYQNSGKKKNAMREIFQSSHQSPVCLAKHAVFPQIVLSVVGNAAAWGSWREESTELN